MLKVHYTIRSIFICGSGERQRRLKNTIAFDSGHQSVIQVPKHCSIVLLCCYNCDTKQSASKDTWFVLEKSPNKMACCTIVSDYYMAMTTHESTVAVTCENVRYVGAAQSVWSCCSHCRQQLYCANMNSRFTLVDRSVVVRVFPE